MDAWVTKTGEHSLQKQAVPSLGERDVLVRLKAVAMNPVDLKLTGNADNVVLGFDGTGTIEKLGSKTVLGFKEGDEVWFAGNYKRAGCFAQFVAIDERIIAKKPKKLDAKQSAAFPLVTLTAWEAFEEGMGITNLDTGKKILIIGGAGGLGSVSIQVAKQQFNLFVIATASRPESSEWSTKMGADLIIDHSKELLPQLGDHRVDYIFCTEDKARTWDQWADLLNVNGRIQLITPPDRPVSLAAFFPKRISVGMELMFTRPAFNVEPEKQGNILKRMAHLVDAGRIQPVDNYHFDWKDIKKGYEQIKTGRSIGKIVFTGF